MTDIVERLRQQAADNPHDTAYNARCTEAADEIERLRHRVFVYVDQLFDAWNELNQEPRPKTIAMLEAEIVRLRTAIIEHRDDDKTVIERDLKLWKVLDNE